MRPLMGHKQTMRVDDGGCRRPGYSHEPSLIYRGDTVRIAIEKQWVRFKNGREVRVVFQIRVYRFADIGRGCSLHNFPDRLPARALHQRSCIREGHRLKSVVTCPAGAPRLN